VKKILITGIEGFVGSYLAEYLQQKEYKIFGIHFADPIKKIGKLYQCDIRDYPHVLKIIKDVKPDAVYHLAAQSSVVQAEKNILDTFSINVQGTLNNLESIRQTNIKSRVIYISSCAVYGQSSAKLTENSNTKPISFYATSKLCSEKICQYYANHYGLNIVMLRPFSHTGAGQSEQFIFPRIAKRVAEIEAGLAEPLLTVGNINIRHDYMDVLDIIRAYELALTKCKSGEVYNITSGKPRWIKKEIEYIISLTNKNIQIESDKSLIRTNDISLLTGSAQKFSKLTGWKPQINFHKTLSDLLNYYREKIT